MSYTTVNALMKGIADAIRAKDGTSAQINHQDFPDRINAIETGKTWDDLNNLTTGEDVVLSTSTNIRSYFLYGTRIWSIQGDLVTSVGTNAFQNCSTLRTAVLPVCTSILANAFNGSGLQTINMPAVQTIGNNAFRGAQITGELTLPNIRTIGEYAFYQNRLTQLDLGASLTSISSYGLQYNSNLATLILRGSTVAQLGTGGIGYTAISGGNGYIYVPSSLLASYQSATNWSYYSAQFRALEDYTVDGTTTGALDPNKI